MIKWFKRIFCKHDYAYAGTEITIFKKTDWINFDFGAKYPIVLHEFRCVKCGKDQIRAAGKPTKALKHAIQLGG